MVSCNQASGLSYVRNPYFFFLTLCLPLITAHSVDVVIPLHLDHATISFTFIVERVHFE